MPSNNTADLFQAETFLAGYFFYNCKYKQTCLVMTNVVFHIPIISAVSYSNFYQKIKKKNVKAHKPTNHWSYIDTYKTWSKASYLNYGDVHSKYIFCSDHC